jgi:tetratricopeptide (TPR) repeat protein
MEVSQTPDPGAAPHIQGDRLSSWKEIAAYLGRDVRTVQRWERTQGLPVHRHRHSRLSTAYAFKSELDRWWDNRPPDGNGGENALVSVDAAPETEPAGASRGWRSPWVAGSVLLSLMAIVIAAATSSRRTAEPAPVAFDARDYVLITAFDNRTGDALYDGSVEHALASALSNSTFVNIVPRIRINDTLELMRRPSNTRLDAEIGREVALRDGGIRVVLAGRVEQFGGRYALTADVLRATDGETAATVREEAEGESEVLPAIRRLAMTVRRRLGESLESTPAVTALPRVSTSSLRALQLFARAQGALGENENAPVDRAAAEKLLRQAIALDPEFAQAHILLANVGGAGVQIGQRTAFLPHVERAVQAAQTAPEVERLVIEAEAEVFRARYLTDDGVARRDAFDRAMASLEASLRLQPDHLRALELLIGVTSFRLDTRLRALELAMKHAELRPTSAQAQLSAAQRCVDHADLARARHYVERAKALNVPLGHLAAHTAAFLALFDASEAWQAGDAVRALAIADRFAADTARLPSDHQVRAKLPLFFIYLSLGRLRQAEALTDDTRAWIGDAVRHQQRGRVLAMRGDREVLAAYLDRHFKTPEEANFVASNLMDAGLLDMARRVIDYHRRRRNDPPVDWYAGQLALVEGRFAEAEALLTRAATQFPPANNQGLKIARQLADAHVGQGRPDTAIRLLEEATRQRVDLAHGWEWLRARDRLAELYRQTGRLADADAVDRELATLLAVADDDHVVKRRIAARAAQR